MQLKSNRSYHINVIKDAVEHFDKRERTLSHRFSKKHSYLNNLTYSEAFFNRLNKLGFFKNMNHIIEIGGGTGEFAVTFLKKFTKTFGRKIRYDMLEISPVLFQSQKSKMQSLKTNPFVEAKNIKTDAMKKIPYKTGVFSGLVIANEVIADFDYLLLNNKKNFGSIKLAAYIKKFPFLINGQSKNNIFPLGVILFLEELYRILSKDGIGIIVEYGHMNYKFKENKIYKHNEINIAFKSLIRICNKIGFECKLFDMVDFLDFDFVEPVLRVGMERFIDDLNGRILAYLPLTKEMICTQSKRSKLNLPEFMFSKKEIIETILRFKILIIKKREETFSIARNSEDKSSFCLIPHRDVFSKVINGKTLIIKEGNDVLYSLNQTGTAVWNLIQKGLGLSHIIKIYMKKYDFIKEKKEGDIIELINQLLKENLVYKKQ